MKFPLYAFAMLIGTGVVQAAPVAQAPMTPVVAELLTEKDGLKISIAATSRGLELRADAPHISVVLQNVSSKDINLFEEWNSFGAYNLWLEVTKVGDKVLDKLLLVDKELMGWGFNGPTTEVLEPGEFAIREIHFPALKQPSTLRVPLYKPFPAPTPGLRSVVTLRAVFANGDAMQLENGKGAVWSGKIASPLKNYRVFWTGGPFPPVSSVESPK